VANNSEIPENIKATVTKLPEVIDEACRHSVGIVQEIALKSCQTELEHEAKISSLASSLERTRVALRNAIVEETQSKEQDKLLAALSKCLGEMHAVEIERTGSGNRGNYATLTDLTIFAMPFITKNGLSFRMEPIEKDDQDYMRSVLGHSSGQWASSKCKIRPDFAKESDANQAYGKSLTYMKKYVFGAYFNLHTGSEK